MSWWNKWGHREWEQRTEIERERRRRDCACNFRCGWWVTDWKFYRSVARRDVKPICRDECIKYESMCGNMIMNDVVRISVVEFNWILHVWNWVFAIIILVFGMCLDILLLYRAIKIKLVFVGNVKSSFLMNFLFINLYFLWY